MTVQVLSDVEFGSELPVVEPDTSLDAAKHRINLIKLNFKIDSGEKLIKWRERFGIGLAKGPEKN